MFLGMSVFDWLGMFLLLFALFCVACVVTIALGGLQYAGNSALAVMWIFLTGVFVMLAFKCFGVY
jgi:hypothetical protein